jgi:hypothetical protein
MCDFTSW